MAVPDDSPKAGEPAKPEAVAAKPAPNNPAASDREALQGMWVYERQLLSDFALAKTRIDPRSLVTPPRMVIHRDRVMTAHSHRVWGETFALDPDRVPKWIDLRPRAEYLTPWGTRPSKAIYKLDGDKLTLACGDHRRPANLDSSDDSGRSTPTVYRREPPPAATTVAATGPLLGRWELARGRHDLTADGRIRETDRGWLEVTTYALFWRYDSTLAGAKRFNDWSDPEAYQASVASFTLDPTKTLPWIDLTLLNEQDGVPTKRYGVYELAADTLRLVLGRNRTFRPLDFGFDSVAADGEPSRPLTQTKCFEFKRVAH